MTGSEDNTLRVWSTVSGKLLKTLEFPFSVILPVVYFSPYLVVLLFFA